MSSNENNNFFFGRIRSVTFTVVGVVTLLKEHHAAWVHSLVTALALFAGFVFSITSIEWMFLILAISMVWVAEALNTSIEYVCDVSSPEFHPLIKKSKDVAAGAVLLATMGGTAIGLIIFIPYVTSAL